MHVCVCERERVHVGQFPPLYSVQCCSCLNRLNLTSSGLTLILGAEACPPTSRTLGRAVLAAVQKYVRTVQDILPYFGRIPTILLLVTLFPISPQGGSLDQCGGEEYRHSLVQAAGSHRHHCPGAHTEAGRRHPHPQLPHQQRQHSTQALLPWSTL